MFLLFFWRDYDGLSLNIIIFGFELIVKFLILFKFQGKILLYLNMSILVLIKVLCVLLSFNFK
jgi:hypothetical protein